MNERRGLFTFLLGLTTFVGVASAHQVQSSRFTAPIPLSLLFGGAAVTVAATAAWLAITGERSEKGRTWPAFVLPKHVATIVRYGARAVFFAGFLVTIVRGFTGPQIAAENVATVFVWAVWFKGIGLLSILVGSPWRVLSPWRMLYDGLTRIEGDEIAALGSYPSWLGSWPALLGFVVGIGILENLTIVPRSPAATAAVIAGYAAVMVLGAVAFGREWFRRADALEVLYRLFGRVAPVGFVTTDDGYRVVFRPPWTGCTYPVERFGLVAFVVATVYTVSFDGFTNTPEFQGLLFGLRNLLSTGPGTSVFIYVLGLTGFVAAFVGVSVVMEAVSESGGWRGTAVAFAPTVVPIAAAYEVAHNYPFVVERLGRLVAVAWSLVVAPIEPLDLLGWLSVPVFWGSQVLLIVAGHVIAVVAAHAVAVARYETLSRARRAHLPLVVLMVGYTVLSLWIISRPVVS
ncbi:hypothetical protein C448_10956 [Halococcus morrhuae DSM 1307]|uniref:Uncharacterized protein n=1 Tax=Halococcus morrhuae DSM 1307 TaxID=931277 RepID=M0M9C1_HALMO|nr:hypothetical protein [Halococcus morrhuae]EMA42346.1 hypothetical protein C448_10956 [Halococcus morrhuae DSM 1307]